MTVPSTPSLLAAADQVKAAVDAYAAAVSATAADVLDPEQAIEDARIEGPDRALFEAIHAFQQRAFVELGLELTDDDEDDEDSEGDLDVDHEDTRRRDYQLLFSVIAPIPDFEAAEAVLAGHAEQIERELGAAGYELMHEDADD